LEPEVRAAIDVILGDVRDRTLVRKSVEGCQYVFHLAALIGIPYSYHAPQSYVETNIVGTLNVLEACRDLGVQRLLQTSTSEVYGTAQYTPIDEQHPLHAQSPYAASKIGADQLAYSYYAAFNVPAVIVRPFNTFGPRQSARAVIPTIIAQALGGGEIHLGGTRPVRDFLFVADNARGFMAAAEAEGVCGEVINLGTGRGVAIGSLAELIGQRLGRELVIRDDQQRQRPERSEVFELLCSAEKARQRLGWEPTFSLEEGLDQTIAWVDAHRAEYRTDCYSI
jgi:NAD dependent epimerase/dehydratase